MDIQKIMNDLERKHPGEAEYLQAVREVLISIEDVEDILDDIKQALTKI